MDDLKPFPFQAMVLEIHIEMPSPYQMLEWRNGEQDYRDEAVHRFSVHLGEALSVVFPSAVLKGRFKPSGSPVIAFTTDESEEARQAMASGALDVAAQVCIARADKRLRDRLPPLRPVEALSPAERVARESGRDPGEPCPRPWITDTVEERGAP